MATGLQPQLTIQLVEQPQTGRIYETLYFSVWPDFFMNMKG